MSDSIRLKFEAANPVPFGIFWSDPDSRYMTSMVHLNCLEYQGKWLGWQSAVLAQEAGRGKLVTFRTLCYGAKFKYSAEEAAVWVKIGHDLIAGWDESKVTDSWIGQPVCSFSDDGNLSAVVFLIGTPPAPVSVAMPERMQGPRLDYGYTRFAEGWNACIDKVKELNQ